MDTEQIRRAVQAAIESIAPEADAQRIRSDRPLRQQIDLDSMDWLNVLAGVQDRLSIEIPASDQGRLTTLDSIVSYVASRQAEHRGVPSRATPPTSSELPCAQHTINGTLVVVRPMRAEDMSLEADFVRHLSTETRYKRFMVSMSELPKTKLRYLTEVDQDRHVALVATVDREGQQALVGVVRYVVDPAGSSCEFAVAVDDAWQGTGLAGVLMHALMDVARARGLTTMEGMVLATNSRMLKFTRQLGFTQKHDPEDYSTVHVTRSL